jgi:hypothetical protein
VVLVAFLVSLALVVIGTTYAVVKGVEFWRQAKSTGRTLSAELALFEERAARTEQLFAEADVSTQALQAAQERLRISHARLNVLLGTFEANRRRTYWLRAFLPPR